MRRVRSVLYAPTIVADSNVSLGYVDSEERENTGKIKPKGDQNKSKQMKSGMIYCGRGWFFQDGA